MKVVSKNKPKGTEYNALKNMKKAARIVKAKDDKRRAENKRINAEARKERRFETEFFEKVEKVEILNFSKGMLNILIEGERKKRGITYGRRNIKLSENLSDLANFEIKLYGEMVKLRKLKNFSEKKEELACEISQENC